MNHNPKEIDTNKLEIVGKLSASMFHEIRNHLSVFKLNLDYLNLSKDSLPEDITDSINMLSEISDKMNHLLNSVLYLSKKSNDDFEIGSLNEVIDFAINMISSRANQNNIHIIKELEVDEPYLNINRSKILQVILNLLSNAFDASHPNTNIYVRTKRIGTFEEPLYLFEVADIGIGIHEEDKEKIFDDFFTLKKSGTGLGLGICKKIIEEHDADISFESEISKGSIFRVIFKVTPLRETE